MKRLMLRAAAIGVLALTAGSIVQAQSVPAENAKYGAWGFDLTGQDRSTRPGDDFFRYANGAWDDRTPIPSDHVRYGVDYVLSDTAEARVRSILEGGFDIPGPAGVEAGKIRAFYSSYLDEKRANALGAKPISADLALIRAAKGRGEIAALMGRRDGSQASMFRLSINADLKDPGHYAVYTGQGGLSLPDRDYYLAPAFAEKKKAYQAYVAKMLGLVGWKNPDAAARAVVEMETRIAEASWTRAEGRDPNKNYHPMQLAELEKAAPGFAWRRWLTAAGLGSVDRVIVGQDTAVPKIAQVFTATPLSTLKAWCAFNLADRSAPFLSKPFVDANFEFRSRTLRGQSELQPRWKRSVAAVNGGMGEAVGQVYVAKYFPPEAKAKIDALVEELRVSLGERIDHLAWMSPETKTKARAKLAQFHVKIAYPNRWRDYSALKISAVDLTGNVRRANLFEWRRQVKRMNGPVDKQEWGMTPQTVNAYYNSTQNEIVFPAAILQPPYFDPDADPAVNYGGIGGVIGHEMTHGFDDQGRKFDGLGVLSDWWSVQDARLFEASAKVLGSQFDSYEPFPGAHVKGELTMGENIADLGGILVALDAYHRSLHGKPAPVIDGLSGDQRFFLAYAQSWRDKGREDTVRQQLVSDPHSPEKYRVNGIVRNVDAWYAAFDVKPGDKLYLAPDQRVRIW